MVMAMAAYTLIILGALLCIVTGMFVEEANTKKPGFVPKNRTQRECESSGSISVLLAGVLLGIGLYLIQV